MRNYEGPSERDRKRAHLSPLQLDIATVHTYSVGSRQMGRSGTGQSEILRSAQNDLPFDFGLSTLDS